jgi:DMSO/TMAO reductase YedYZ molybdopterin-dependent catalytic subunit
MAIRDGLPEHEIPEVIRRRAAPGTIRVHGRVAREIVLSLAELARMPRAQVSEPFTCEEGWTVPGVRWSGIPLEDVVAQAGPLDDARCVRVWSDTYSISLSMADLKNALLADTLDGQPLAIEHGGPWRLVVPGGQCFTSVKWVDRLELMAEPEPGTGEAIARARLARS